VLAVYQHDIQLLADAAPRLLAEHPPLVALRRWCDRLARYGRVEHGVADVLHAASSASVVSDSYGPVVGAIAPLMRASQDAGLLRTDVTPDDVLLLLGFLWRISPGPGRGAGEPAARPGPRPAGHPVMPQPPTSSTLVSQRSSLRGSWGRYCQPCCCPPTIRSPRTPRG